ncbi:hypothetical protein [Streptomyces sp. NBC_00670]|jgi:hypothetical protein|uniref:hypothetical protein n=1 Tax=Streptomyces sp. NBC_00670 TaxID=2975804 RepID=UPI002E322AEE|nr:hypothetical protein [Streptomyces sp. NBC_00670]
MKQLPVIWFVLHVVCAVCKAQAAHLEFTPPGLSPARWPRWDTAMRQRYAARRDADRWWLVAESEAYTNGCGENVTAEDVARYQSAFVFPRTFAQVHDAGLKGDAGFCAACDVPYCARHWKPDSGGGTACPLGHPR